VEPVDVSILVVSYNTRELTLDCLRSVPAAAARTAHEIIVLDNASTDGSADAIEQEFAAVRLIRADRNLGFGAGVNRAATEARGLYLLLLNPDMVLTAGCVDRMVSFARVRPEFGIYGGRTLQPDRSLEPSSCWGLPSMWSMLCFATGLSTVAKHSRVFNPESLGSWQRDSTRPVGMVTGCLLLIRRKLFESMGGFDDKYFMYGEDADLNVRVREAGYRPVLVHTAEAVHLVGAASASTSLRRVMILRARVSYIRDHMRLSGLALMLLKAGVWLRATARAGDDWRASWATRESWLRGYEPVTTAGGPVAL